MMAPEMRAMGQALEEEEGGGGRRRRVERQRGDREGRGGGEREREMLLEKITVRQFP